MRFTSGVSASASDRVYRSGLPVWKRGSGVLRQGASADARIQRIEDGVQPTRTRLTSGYLEQDRACFRRGVLNCPADLGVSDMWIAIVIELKSQCGIGRWTDDVLRLMDIR